jgi:hypothetical protein
MNRFRTALIAICATLSAWSLWQMRPPASVPQQARPTPSVTARPATSEQSTSTESSTPPPASTPIVKAHTLADDLNAPGSEPQRDVEILHSLVRQYLRRMHQRRGHPIGDDIDLAHVLTGHNPLKLVILPPEHPALTADGHLRDRWGTPYFIHPRGRDAFEIRSAGPDRKMFTADDLVANPSPVGQTTPGAPEAAAPFVPQE